MVEMNGFLIFSATVLQQSLFSSFIKMSFYSSYTMDIKSIHPLLEWQVL